MNLRDIARKVVKLNVDRDTNSLDVIRLMSFIVETSFSFEPEEQESLKILQQTLVYRLKNLLIPSPDQSYQRCLNISRQLAEIETPHAIHRGPHRHARS